MNFIIGTLFLSQCYNLLKMRKCVLSFQIYLLDFDTFMAGLPCCHSFCCVCIAILFYNLIIKIVGLESTRFWQQSKGFRQENYDFWKVLLGIR